MVLAVTGAAAWTVVQMYCSAFIAARRADGMFAVQGLISLFKVLLVVPLCAAGLGAPGIVVAWVASSVIGAAAGAFWLLPRIGPGSHRGRGDRGATRGDARGTRGGHGSEPTTSRTSSVSTSPASAGR